MNILLVIHYLYPFIALNAPRMSGGCGDQACLGSVDIRLNPHVRRSEAEANRRILPRGIRTPRSGGRT